MDYQVDLDPTHRALRLTVRSAVITLEGAEDCYVCLSQITSQGGDYAAIYDLSAATNTTISTEMIRNYAHRTPQGNKYVMSAYLLASPKFRSVRRLNSAPCFYPVG